MKRRVWTAMAIAWWLVAQTSAASAQAVLYSHVVRNGETLASIARRYYQRPPRESVLAAENGLMAHGGAAIITGMRLVLPVVSYHQTTEGDTWSKLATRYYGDPHRAFVLIEANHAEPGHQPDKNSELLVPYPVRHVGAHGEGIARVTELYYGDSRPETVRLVKRFNGLSKNRLRRGQVLLLPMSDLVLSRQGKQVLTRQSRAAQARGRTRALQSWVEKQLPRLRGLARRGNFAEVVGLGHRLLGVGELTEHQLLRIHTQLAAGYLALQRRAAALRQLRAALAIDPKLSFDDKQHSPLLRAALREARRTP
ncbi:MAG: LysM peptidoglycan-binding domain-containing protein [Polyangiales bacterium]